MKTRANILICIGGMGAVLAACVVMWRLHVSTNTNELLLHEMNARNAALREQLQTQDRQKDAASRMPEQMAEADAARAVAEKAAAEKKRQDTSTYHMIFYDRLDKDPAYRLKYYSAKRAEMDADYGPFVSTHHLSDVQKEAIFNAMLQKQLRYDRVPLVYLEERLSLEDGTLAKQLRADADKEYNHSIQVALGDHLTKEFKRYERVKSDWAKVSEFAGNMAIDGTPLSVGQASQLVEAIAKSKTKNQIDWIAVDERAREILSARQFEYFQNTESAPAKYRAELDEAFQKLKDEAKKKAANRDK